MSSMSQGDDVRPGDWTCPSCSTNVFASKLACFKCQTKKPGTPGAGSSFSLSQPVGGSQPDVRPGDWTCPSCASVVFASKSACFKCDTPKPHGAVLAGEKPGDWRCPNCMNNCFASKVECFKCRTPKPGLMAQPQFAMASPVGGTVVPPPPLGGRQIGTWTELTDSQGRLYYHQASTNITQWEVPAEVMQAKSGQHGGGGMFMPQAPVASGGLMQGQKPGDWICPGCKSNVFASKSSCFRCSTPKPAEGSVSSGFMFHQPSFGGKSNNPDMRPGDWTCSDCGTLCFASKTNCFKCNAPKADSKSVPPNMKAGDWMCPDCNAHVFASKSSCFKCGSLKPLDADNRYAPY